MSEQTPSNDPVPEAPLPPATLPGSPPAPSPFAELPRPGRKGQGAAVPFDPMGWQVFNTLDEVTPKAPASETTVTKGQLDAARRKATFIPKFLTLEAMYAQHPEIARLGSLRVVREQPAWVTDVTGEKIKVNGILSFKHEIIGTERFAQLFGGYKYRVYGMVDQEDPQNKGAPPQPVDVALAEFDIPSPPVLEYLPIAASDMASEAAGASFYGDYLNMMGMGTPYGRRPPAFMPPPSGYGFLNAPQPSGYPFMAPAQPPGTVPVEPVLNFASRVMDQRAAPPFISDAMWQVLGKQSSETTQVLKDAFMEQARQWEGRERAFMDEINNLRSALTQVHNRPSDTVQMIEGVAKLTAAQKGGADSDAIRQLRDDSERAFARLKDEHDRELHRMKQEHDKIVDTLRTDAERIFKQERDTWDMKLRMIEDARKSDQARWDSREKELRDDARLREEILKKNFQEEIDRKDRDLQSRIAELRDHHATAMQTLRDTHAHEIRTRDMVQANTQTTTDRAHQVEMRAVQSDLARLSGELEEKRRIVEQTMAEKNKPILEQVAQLQQLSQALQDMAGGGPADGEGAGEKWYNSEIAKVVAGLVLSKGADLLPKLAEAAKQASTAGAVAGAAPAARPRGSLPAGYPPAPRPHLPPRKQRRITFADPEGVPVRDYSDLPSRRVEGDVGPKVFPRPGIIERPGVEFEGPQEPLPPPAPRPRRPVPRQPLPAQTPVAAPPPPPGSGQAAEPGYARPRAPQSGAAPPPAADTSAQPGWDAFSWMPMGAGEVQQFLGNLEQAFAHKMAPTELVHLYLTNFPIALVRQVPELIPVDRLVEAIRTSPATNGWGLATGAGRRYLTDVWARITAAVREHEQQSAPADAPEREFNDQQAPAPVGPQASPDVEMETT